jgi:cytochrome P450
MGSFSQRWLSRDTVSTSAWGVSTGRAGYATEDIQIRGVTIPRDGRVLLSYPSANRDEEAFSQPMVFDVHRPDADRLLSFGGGAHFCLGSQFARREVRTMLSRLAHQLRSIERAGPAQWSESLSLASNTFR